MTNRSENRLVLFLSNAGELGKWQQQGILRRELLLYRELLRENVFERITVLTWSRGDRAVLDNLRAEDPVFDRVDLMPVAARFDGATGARAMLGGVLAVLRNREALARARWLKTNQMSGALPAVVGRLASGTPLLLRFGYPLSRNFRQRGERLRELVARSLEWVAMRAASRIVVTSTDIHAELAARPALQGRVHLVPSYVDTSIFRPDPAQDLDAPMLCVARFEREKNLPALIEAAHRMGAALDLLGSGPNEAELRRLAADGPATIRFLPRTTNEGLAELMHRYGLFVLPSFNEGLPKVLIEAMASGMTCVATTIPGVTDLIRDGETGYLIEGFDAEAIAAAVTRARVRRDPAVPAAAARFAEQNFGLARHVACEARIYSSDLGMTGNSFDVCERV